MASTQPIELVGLPTEPVGHGSVGYEDAAEPEPYIYSPLTNPNNIRLIWVEPGKGEQQVKVKMFESLCARPWYKPNRNWVFRIEALQRLLPDRQSPARIIEHPKRALRNFQKGIKRTEFSVLSYVWGDATDTIPITVNRRCCRITRNLYQFLEKMRNESGRQGPYWADALCINQDDNDEKSFQVAMMSDIYSNASRCIIWLGKEDDRTQMAFQLLREIESLTLRSLKPLLRDLRYFIPIHFSERERGIRWRLYCCPHFARAMSKIKIRDVGTEPYSAQRFAAVFELLTRPWFERMWTLQEFVLPRDVDFECGKHRVNDVAVMVFVRLNDLLLGGDPVLKIDTEIVPRNNDLLRSIYGACHLRSMSDGTPMGITVTENVHNIGQHRKSTDPRDRLYALLAMSRQHKPLPVDYNCSARDVYRNFAVHCLRYHPYDDHLTLFNAVSSPGVVLDLPSWAPDHTATTKISTHFSVWTFGKLWLRLFGTRNEEKLYRGAGGRPQRLHFSSDLMILKACGIHFDTIRSVHKSPSLHIQLKQMKQYIVQEALDKLYFQPSKFTLEETVFQTACCDKAMLDDGLPYFRLSTSKNFFKTSVIAKYKSQGKVEYSTEMCRARVLITTKNGYMGLAPLSSQVGDIVAVLVGQTFPFILRRTNDHYIMIGLAYGT